MKSLFGFPHARGDGPPYDPLGNGEGRFSPRPWGWSAAAFYADRTGKVFPTPVGMVRMPSLWAFPTSGFPHARGDGPTPHRPSADIVEFSPRPWGWSDFVDAMADDKAVFPTPVGMVRWTAPSITATGCFPHARGDGPLAMDRLDERNAFSPRPWGWSELDGRGTTGGWSFPHARGDGPLLVYYYSLIFLFSPRPWGWSDL